MSAVNGHYFADGYCDGAHRFKKRGTNFYLIRCNAQWYLSFLGPGGGEGGSIESAAGGREGAIDYYCTPAKQTKNQANPPGIGWMQSSKTAPLPCPRLMRVSENDPW